MTETGISTRAARMTGSGPCQRLSLEEAVEAVMHSDNGVWLDIDVTDTQHARSLLIDKLGLHELAVEDALSEKERPNLMHVEGMLFLAVPVVDPKVGLEETPEIGFFIKNRSLITVSNGKVRVLDVWFERWSTNPRALGDDPASLLHAILDNVVDDYFLAIDVLEEEVEDLLEVIYGGDASRIVDVLNLKRKLLKFRRIVAPVRDILNGLLRRDLDHISAEMRPYYQDIYDHILRIGELIDLNRDTLASLLDVHLSTVSNNLNNVVKKMTVFSTVLMTMALVSGIYGMNFKHMPELEWANGYPFALGLMGVLALGIVGVFRWIKWI